jgi:hypothetical protein
MYPNATDAAVPLSAEAVSPDNDAQAGPLRRRWRAVFGAALGLGLGSRRPAAPGEARSREADGIEPDGSPE